LKYITLEKFRKPKKLVKVLRLSGVIGKIGLGKGGMTLDALNDSIEKAFDKNPLAVCLQINSPGGSPVQSELIANRIITLSKEKSIPVYSFVEDMAASGGFWLSCAGQEIYASKSSIIGSIGVIS
jgi:ClpP class serine protease